ncbi:MAG: hypothetical protein DRP01_06040 [Archaeoglobales archaeon]|nr:MAG: hypothetical protein DRP01_06040 [Archaeoglobales archaeon]
MREFRNLEEINKFIDMCNHLLSIVKNDDEKARLLIELAGAYMYKSGLTEDKGDLKMAEDLLIKAIDTAKNDNYKGLALSFYSELLKGKGELKNALEILERMKDMKYGGFLGLIIRSLIILQSFGLSVEFLRKKVRDKEEMAQSVLSKLSELSKDAPSYLKPFIEQCMARVYMLLEEYDKAEESLKKALKESKNQRLTYQIYLNLVQLYMTMGNFKKAEDFAKKSLKIAEEFKNEFLIKQTKDLLERIQKS